MEFRILGPMEVTEQGQSVPLGGAKQRALLAVLLLHPNEVVSSERLIDGVWAGEPPATALKTLHVYVSQLRKRLGTDVIMTRAPGYLLRVDRDDLDLSRFEVLVKEAKGAAPEVSAAKLREALALWRGPAIAEFTYEPFAQAEVGRLEELRVAALEERIEADLALGLHADLVGELEALVAQHPLRERMRGQLMLSLYRSGRQAEALHVYQDGRRLLVDQLGIDPGTALHQLEKQILNQDPSLTLDEQARTPHAPPPEPATQSEERKGVSVVPRCPSCDHEIQDAARFCEFCGAALARASVASGERRKVVTVLFCDVTGSTALGEQLDPESLRAVLARYFEMARVVVGRHGGSVEKFIGDAVMAVFGVPVLHEDDALRALRAASDLRAGLRELNDGLQRDFGTTLEIRIGVNTGEVVTGTTERLATGDAVNVTARLEQAARPGEILLGAETRLLAGDAATVEEVEPLDLKGKSAPLAAYRLVGVSAAPPSRSRFDGAMVGRERELERLKAAMVEAVESRSCQLFTVLGAAGVGKSRLAHAFLSGLENVRVVRGTCLSYGEGITYWPVLEVLKQLLGLDAEAGLTSLGVEESSSRAIRAVLGEPGFSASVDEIAWATRRVLEAAAEESPLVVVLDDIHWGEEAFLGLVDHVADLSRDAPIFLFCMARPELLDRRPTWGGGKLNATTVLLEQLSVSDADELVSRLIDGVTTDAAFRDRILDAAEGNPLFLEEMVALVAHAPDATVVVPPTIQALLAARLDQLDPDERSVLERGSVEGRTFHRGAVEALSATATETLAPLTALVRRELLRPDRPQLPGEDAFRFRHLLIRDATYDALPKSTRADLHERFAAWIGDHAFDLVELDEIMGYHLEQAHRYRTALGPTTEVTLELAVRAAERLASAGGRAERRGDVRAATNLLARAVNLYPQDDPRKLKLLPALGRALTDGGEWGRADAVLSEAIEAGTASGDRWLVADATVAVAFVRIHREMDSTHQRIGAELAAAVKVFEEFGDEAGLARALGFAGNMRIWAGDTTGAMADLERAVEHARAAGDTVQEETSLSFIVLAVLRGPTPAAEGLLRCRDLRNRPGLTPRLESAILRCESRLEAIQGNLDEARELNRAAAAIVERPGYGMTAAAITFESGEIELLAGNPERAEQIMRPAAEILLQTGDYGHYSSCAPWLAQALVLLDRDDEATEIIDLIAENTIDDDLDGQLAWRHVRATLLARKEQYVAAEEVAREAVSLATRTDYAYQQARAHDVLANVLALAGQTQEAVIEYDRAVQLYEEKGDIVDATDARARQTELQSPAGNA